MPAHSPQEFKRTDPPSLLSSPLRRPFNRAPREPNMFIIKQSHVTNQIYFNSITRSQSDSICSRFPKRHKESELPGRYSRAQHLLAAIPKRAQHLQSATPFWAQHHQAATPAAGSALPGSDSRVGLSTSRQRLPRWAQHLPAATSVRLAPFRQAAGADEDHGVPASASSSAPFNGTSLAPRCPRATAPCLGALGLRPTSWLPAT